MAAKDDLDIRALFLSEIARFKTDVSDLYDKINALRESAQTDKLAMVTNLNAEFNKIQQRFADLNLCIQQIMSDASHGGDLITQRISTIQSDLESKIAGIKSSLDTEYERKARVETISIDLEELAQEVKTLKDKVDNLETLVTAHHLDDHINALIDHKLKPLRTALVNLSRKVLIIGTSVSLIVAVLTWLGKEVGGAYLKTILPEPKPKTESVSTKTAHDSLKTKE